MNYKETTNKLTSSRIIKFSLILVFILFATRLISLGMIAWITMLVNSLHITDKYKVEAYLSLAELLNLPVSGAIATIGTAVIARYGLREVSSNVNDTTKHTDIK